MGGGGGGVGGGSNKKCITDSKTKEKFNLALFDFPPLVFEVVPARCLCPLCVCVVVCLRAASFDFTDSKIQIQNAKLSSRCKMRKETNEGRKRKESPPLPLPALPPTAHSLPNLPGAVPQ